MMVLSHAHKEPNMEETQTINFVVPIEMYAKFKKKCVDQHITMSELLRKILKEHLNGEKK